ncbi:MAG: ATP-binding protein [Anaerolineae bacterium]|nr:ATP-binding protein [Anaerolineae bacterium]
MRWSFARSGGARLRQTWPPRADLWQQALIPYGYYTKWYIFIWPNPKVSFGRTQRFHLAEPKVFIWPNPKVSFGRTQRFHLAEPKVFIWPNPKVSFGRTQRFHLAEPTQLLETFVFQELRRQASWHETALSFYHFRDKDGAEVDLVLEQGVRAVAGIEVKAAATVTETDFRGLRKLQADAGERFVVGVVLYDGEASVGFGPGLFAVPIRALWETIAPAGE